MQKQIEMLQKQMEISHDAVMKTLDAFRAEMRSEFASLRADKDGRPATAPAPCK